MGVKNQQAMPDDKSGLLTSMELTEKQENQDKAKDQFFEDGVRKIDYILAYEIVEDEDEDDKTRKEEMRKTYLENLKEEGLEIEEANLNANNGNSKEEYGTFSDDKKKEGNEIRYIKVHIPFEELCDTAEDMQMKKPIREYDIDIKEWYQKTGPLWSFIEKVDPFQIRDKHTRDEKSYFVKKFEKAQMEEYIYGDKPEKFFSSVDRSRAAYFIIRKTKFGDEELDLGMENLTSEGIFLDAFPLHCGPVREDSDNTPVNDRQYLQADWASMSRIFKYQPIPAIRSYFGEKIALYFAWLGFYTAFLVPAAIVGIICFIYGVASSFSYVPVKEICASDMVNGKHLFYMCPLCDKLCSYYLLKDQGCMYGKITHFFDNNATLFFALFMSIWATVFLEFWKRKQISLAYEWHTMDFEEEEERPRPEYLAKINRLKKNPITMKMEPYMPPHQRFSRLMGAFGVVVFFIILVLGAVVGVIVFRAAFYIILVGQKNDLIRSRSKMVVSAVAACINLVTIKLLKFVYQRIAVKLTNWENPRTATDYEDSFTIKMFWFQFINTYSSIFYVAFFKSEFFVGSPGNYKRFTGKNFRFDGCAVQGCFLELTIQLVIIMVGQQIIGNIMEILLPYLKKKYQDWKNRKQAAYTATDEPQWVSDFEGEMQTKFSLFWQYLEIVLQYGFVTMFVAAFPLAPFFALVNNIVEIRLDAVNFVHNFRRPYPMRAEDIGAWYGILATLTMFSTLVNAFVLAYTSELIPRMVWMYYKSTDGEMAGYQNWSLSYFNVSDFNEFEKPEDPTKNNLTVQTHCRYPGFHNPTAPYARSSDYWVLTSARLAFVIAFQAFVLTVKFAIAYIIPDVPKTLELKMKREKYLAEEHEQAYKVKSGRRKQKRKKSKATALDEGVPHSEPVLSPEV